MRAATRACPATGRVVLVGAIGELRQFRISASELNLRLAEKLTKFGNGPINDEAPTALASDRGIWSVSLGTVAMARLSEDIARIALFRQPPSLLKLRNRSKRHPAFGCVRCCWVRSEVPASSYECTQEPDRTDRGLSDGLSPPAARQGVLIRPRLPVASRPETSWRNLPFAREDSDAPTGVTT